MECREVVAPLGKIAEVEERLRLEHVIRWRFLMQALLVCRQESGFGLLEIFEILDQDLASRDLKPGIVGVMLDAPLEEKDRLLRLFEHGCQRVGGRLKGEDIMGGCLAGGPIPGQQFLRVVPLKMDVLLGMDMVVEITPRIKNSEDLSLMVAVVGRLLAGHRMAIFVIRDPSVKVGIRLADHRLADDVTRVIRKDVEEVACVSLLRVDGIPLFGAALRNQPVCREQ